jgi:hypothetical protein
MAATAPPTNKIDQRIFMGKFFSLNKLPMPCAVDSVRTLDNDSLKRENLSLIKLLLKKFVVVDGVEVFVLVNSGALFNSTIRLVDALFSSNVNILKVLKEEINV